MDEQTWKEYERYGQRLIRVFGGTALVQDLGPGGFSAAEGNSPENSQKSRHLERGRSQDQGVFQLGRARRTWQGLVSPSITVRPGFQPPSSKAIKRQIDQQPPKVFARNQIRRLLAKAKPTMRAMMLLGINFALGNTYSRPVHAKPNQPQDGLACLPTPQDRRGSSLSIVARDCGGGQKGLGEQEAAARSRTPSMSF